MKFVVYRNVHDYDDVFRTEVAEFDTEQEAEDFRDRAESRNKFHDTFYTVEEE